MRRPAFQFYPADWRKDAALQSCSIGARGAWHELLCVMHECLPYGHLSINGKRIDDSQAARLIGVDIKEYRRFLIELEAAGVPSKTADGTLFSRRMVKDEHIRTVRADAGKLGGNPTLLGEKVNQTTPDLDKQTVKQIPTPSSSASELPSSSKEKTESKAKAARSRQTQLSPGFQISDRVREWAKREGHDRLEARFEHFIGKVKGKGYTYIDWDEGFMSAVRENWAKLPPAPGTLSAVGQRTAEALKDWIDSGEKNGTDGP